MVNSTKGVRVMVKVGKHLGVVNYSKGIKVMV